MQEYQILMLDEKKKSVVENMYSELEYKQDFFGAEMHSFTNITI